MPLPLNALVFSFSVQFFNTKHFEIEHHKSSSHFENSDFFQNSDFFLSVFFVYSLRHCQVH